LKSIFPVSFLLSPLLSPVGVIVLYLLCTGVAVAQTDCPELPFVRGLRVYGGDDETALPVMYKDGCGSPDHITIRFDVSSKQPPRLKIRFRHCNKDWKVDTDFFVRDDFFTVTRYLAYQQAPAGVEYFSWRFTNIFPGPDNPFVRFRYSGNWVFEVQDEQDDDAVYASGRFIVVEKGVRAGLTIFNDYWTENEMPLDRVHRLQLAVSVPDSLYADYVKTVDFYRNHSLVSPYRVDAYDYQSNTRVEGLGLKQKTFNYLNALPGNGYRYWDFRNVAAYANNTLVRRIDGADFTRFRFGTDPMHMYGSSRTGAAESWDTDYMCVLFELNHQGFDGRSIFLAGDFNNWDPGPSDMLTKNEKSNKWEIRKRLLRGAYEYQYVVGYVDEETGTVKDQDWTTLEGNAWDAENLYWAVVYYDDDQFGGVHRAIGFFKRVAGK
jgi:hypothetical protein